MKTIYTPLDNFFFFKVMGEKGDEVQLLGFINAVLHRTGKNRFSSVEILENKTFSGEVKGDKSGTLDVRAVLQDGTRTNTEVQVRNQHNMGRRSLFYWSREFARSLEAGQDYSELPNVIGINILNYNFPPVREVHTCFHLREDTHRDYILTEALEIHYINMVQYRKKLKSNLEDPLSLWLAWLNKGKGKKLAEEAAKMDAAIQAANDRMVYVTGDKKAILEYERYQKALFDHTSAINYASDKGMRKGIKAGREIGLEEGRQEGRDEGLREGRDEASLDIAQKMKTMGFSAEQIRAATGISEEKLGMRKG